VRESPKEQFMKRMMFGALAVALMAGCSTNQTSFDNARSIPSSRALSFQGPVSGAAAKLLVTRDGGVLGSGCYLGVFVNGRLSARIGPGERVVFNVPAGDNLIGSGSDPEGNGLCAFGGVTLREVNANVKQSESKRFRISGDMNGGFSIAPSSF
jgi:hypothetical protein